jgi:hypothetical protein
LFRRNTLTPVLGVNENNIKEAQSLKASASPATLMDNAPKPFESSALWWPKSMIWSREDDGITKPKDAASTEPATHLEEISPKPKAS